MDPSNPAGPDRDIPTLRKGHDVYAFYLALAKRGFIPLGDLGYYDRPGKYLCFGHPSRKFLGAGSWRLGTIGDQSFEPPPGPS
jgi:transketolase